MISARLLDAGLLVLVGLLVALGALRRASPPAGARARRGWVVVWAVIAGAWLASTPALSTALLAALEPAAVDPWALSRRLPPGATAVVVLSSGAGPEFPGASLAERLDGAGTARVIGAARVYRALDPAAVVVTGRALGPDPTLTARAMRELLVTLGVPADRVALETAARTTRENARFTVAMARARGWRNLVVVTSASHLRRAQREFSRAGFDAEGVPVHFVGRQLPSALDLIPSAGGLALTQQALHEILGRFRP